MKNCGFVLFTILLFVSLSVRAQALTEPVMQNTDEDHLLEQLRTYLRDNDYDDALTVINELLQLDSPSFPLYKLYNLRGIVKEKMGSYSEATESYHKALELQPDSATVRLNVALNDLRLEKYGDAAHEFATLIAQDKSTTGSPLNPFQQAPVSAEAIERFARSINPGENLFFSLGRLFLRHHLPQGAVSIFSVGTQVLPQSAQLHYGLGWTLWRMGKFKDAENSFRKALDLKPDFYSCCVHLGDAYLSSGDFDKAAETFRACIQMDPRNYSGHYYLGTALMKARPPHVDEAIAELQQALELNPYSLNSRLELGKAFAAKSLHPQAFQEFSAVARVDPQSAEAQYGLGMAEKALGKSAEARQYLKRFETLKAREVARMVNPIVTEPLGSFESEQEKIAGAVVAFYDNFKQALVQGNAEVIWTMLTEGSKALYEDDPQSFRETLFHLDPALIDRINRSSVSGGKLFAGRIICEFNPVDGVPLPPLVLIQEDDGLRIDYASDLNFAELGYLETEPDR